MTSSQIFKKASIAAISLLAVMTCSGIVSSCSKEEKETEKGETYYVNWFGKNVMNLYYLWNEDIATKISNWDLDGDPEENVQNMRYTLSDGTAYDRWTTMFPDYTEMSSSIAGDATGTYGYDFTLYYYDSSKERVVPVITYVYADSPAGKAGLKRGDVILTVNGKTLTPDNYYDIVMTELLNSSSCTITLLNGTSDIKLTSVEMYEDPVFLYKTFTNGSKVVGYLMYNSFTAASAEKLVEVCKEFKEKNVTELILDLRYNSGGLVTTENLLASMLAPYESVLKGEVYSTEVYNKNLSEYFDSETKFTTEHEISYDNVSKTLSTADANIGLSKIYAITSVSTASASESLLCCLKPYVDIELIGETTYGKFCSGLIYPCEEFYEDYKEQMDTKFYNKGISYSGTWGIYVMVGRFADKNGNTLCMPNGISPDYEISDNPEDGIQLGNENEVMLAAALKEAGITVSSKASKKVSPSLPQFEGKFTRHIPTRIIQKD